MKKTIKWLIAFVISIILSAIISTILHLIFSKQIGNIINLNITMIIESIKNSKEHLEMFVLIIIAFMLSVILTSLKIFNLKDYKSKNYKVTDNIEIPLPVGDKQTQQGSAWWLPKKEFKKSFGVNRLDITDKEISKLLELVKIDKKCINENKENENTETVNPIFKNGGLVIGKKDKYILKPSIKRFKHIKIPLLKLKKVEDIYYIDDDLHSLTIGATRSGKTRSLVLQTIVNTGLAGENMIISDPKRRTLPIYCKNIRKTRLQSVCFRF